HRLMRPPVGVESLAAKTVRTGNARKGIGGQRAERRAEEPGRTAPTVVQRHIPAPCRFIECGGRHAAVELDITPQVKPVGNVVQVAKRLRLGNPSASAGSAPGAQATRT